jgi:cytochrome c
MMRSIRGGLAIALLLPLAACQSEPERDYAADLAGGDPVRGKGAIRHYGCKTCHSIPGIEGEQTTVGPSLEGFADRTFIGGVIENNPENLVRWLQNPQQIDPMTTMPATGATEKDARDIAAFLYTLR